MRNELEGMRTDRDSWVRKTENAEARRVSAELKNVELSTNLNQARLNLNLIQIESDQQKARDQEKLKLSNRIVSLCAHNIALLQTGVSGTLQYLKTDTSKTAQRFKNAKTSIQNKWITLKDFWKRDFSKTNWIRAFGVILIFQMTYPTMKTYVSDVADKLVLVETPVIKSSNSFSPHYSIQQIPNPQPSQPSKEVVKDPAKMFR